MDLLCRFGFPPISLLMRKFALTAGLSSLGSPHFVVVAGLAELFSGAISMGVGGYLSTKAERDNYRYLLRQTRQRVETSCSKALEQEVFEILAPYGVSSTDCKKLVQSLEIAEKAGSDTGHADKGLTQFLLKFGTGAETISTWRLYASALTIGVSYFIGGLIPMVASSLAVRD
jgi:VIT1/CCC1 family predicted Fe2+/Mn2+ transporter